MKIPNRRTIINSKIVFSVTIVSIATTVVSVWFYGIGKHKTVIENSLLSTSILSIIFFLFITISLYNGTKLKDTLGKITNDFDSKKLDFLKDITSGDGFGDSPLDSGDGIGGIIVSILLWILATIVISYLFFVLGTIIWFSILVFFGMLYWIFFRALRVIFKKSSYCSGSIERSVLYGLLYTVLYNFWIYGIILLSMIY